MSEITHQAEETDEISTEKPLPPDLQKMLKLMKQEPTTETTTPTETLQVPKPVETRADEEMLLKDLQAAIQKAEKKQPEGADEGKRKKAEHMHLPPLTQAVAMQNTEAEAEPHNNITPFPTKRNEVSSEKKGFFQTVKKTWHKAKKFIVESWDKLIGITPAMREQAALKKQGNQPPLAA